MRIAVMNMEKLMPASYHPRRILGPDDPAMISLRRLIEEFGYVDPIVWNQRTGNIVGGHQRAAALRELGIGAAEVSVVDLPEKKEKLLNVALNKISGEWDFPRLKDLMIDLEKMDLDVSLTGFSPAEIEKLLGRDVREDDFDAAAEAEKIRTPVTKRGDIWLLGRHRLLCGDSTSPEEMARLMSGARAGMVFTDPPYNVNYGASMKDKLRTKVSRKNAGRTILNDHFETNEGFYEFLHSAIEALRPYAAGDAYICMSSSELHTLQRAFAASGGHFSTFIIWVKNQFTLGRANYQRQYEPILYGWFEGSSHYWSGVRNLGDVCGIHEISRDVDGTPLVRVEACGIESDVWEFPKPSRNKEHPTMKPIALCARGMRNSSKPGDSVLDSFTGSGSTLIAAEQIGRTFYGMELSEVFCDVVVKRWESLTGRKAEILR